MDTFIEFLISNILEFFLIFYRPAEVGLPRNTMTMVNFLQASGAPAHPLFSGSNVLQAESIEGGSKGRVVHVTHRASRMVYRVRFINSQLVYQW